MAAGVDSVDLPAFVEALNAKFDVSLPPTLVLECGTLREIASRIIEGAETSLPAGISGVRLQLSSRQALVAAQARLPGGLGGAGAPLDVLLGAGGDAVGTVPTQRWQVADSGPPAGRYGGFLLGAEAFDAGFFGISAAEAKATDPQQRLMLEYGYSSLHAAGERMGSLAGADVGVFLGIMNADFASKNTGSTSVYAATGGAISIASGRLSFALGMQGPCASYDTACSSGLIAVHAGSSALALGECPSALTCAVSLMLSPMTHLLYARAGMLSKDGRCKTFDARANGYARGEGVGVASLKPAPEGTSAPLLLGGAMVRSDGKSASLTAPNGTAQAKLLKATAAAASLTSVGLIEAHGTGTPLGDPTEMNALARAHKGSSAAIGSLKGSMGHLEPTAGLAGLLCLMDLVVQGTTGVNAQLRILNPLLKTALSTDTKARVSAQQLNVSKAASSAGVSSFGYSGTIAHAVVITSSDPMQPADARPRAPISRSKKARFVIEATKASSALQVAVKKGDSGKDQTPAGDHWLYELAWAVVSPTSEQVDDAAKPARLNLLVVANAHTTAAPEFVCFFKALPSHQVQETAEVTDAMLRASSSYDAVLLLAGQSFDEMEMMKHAATLLTAQAKLKAPIPMLWCTAGTQSVDRSPTASFLHAGLWGLARSVRGEPNYPAVTMLDLQLAKLGSLSHSEPNAAMASWAAARVLKVSNGYVRGLSEQETRCAPRPWNHARAEMACTRYMRSRVNAVLPLPLSLASVVSFNLRYSYSHPHPRTPPSLPSTPTFTYLTTPTTYIFISK